MRERPIVWQASYVTMTQLIEAALGMEGLDPRAQAILRNTAMVTGMFAPKQ